MPWVYKGQLSSFLYKMVACELCDQSFPFIYQLLEHKELYHKKPTNNEDKDTKELQIDEDYPIDDTSADSSDKDSENPSPTVSTLTKVVKKPELNYKELYHLRDQHARKFERLYKTKLTESKQHLSRIRLFEKQLDEFITNFKDSTFNEFSDSIINSKNIADFLELSRLFAAKKFVKVSRSNQLLQAIKTLCTGLKYAVIPLVVFQRKRLNEKERKLIKVVDKKSVEDIKKLFLKYTKEFANIFKVVEKTLLLLKDLENESLKV